MYFWDIDKLVRDLKTNRVTQTEEVKYLVAFFVFVVTDYTISLENYYDIDAMYILFSLVQIVIVALGVIYCYKVNKGRDNRDFIKRFICISLPVAVRFLAILVVLGFIIGNVSRSGSFDWIYGDEEGRSLFQFVLEALVSVSYYMYLGWQFRAFPRDFSEEEDTNQFLRTGGGL